VAVVLWELTRRTQGFADGRRAPPAKPAEASGTRSAVICRALAPGPSSSRRWSPARNCRRISLGERFGVKPAPIRAACAGNWPPKGWSSWRRQPDRGGGDADHTHPDASTSGSSSSALVVRQLAGKLTKSQIAELDHACRRGKIAPPMARTRVDPACHRFHILLAQMTTARSGALRSRVAYPGCSRLSL